MPYDDDLATAGLVDHAQALAGGIEVVLPRWVIDCVERVYRAWAGEGPPALIRADAVAAGEEARANIGGRVRALLETDIDQQRTTPLALLRQAVAYPTGVLEAAGVPAVVRPPDQVALFPADLYGLTPAALADLDPGLAGPGLAWGAAKAWVHRRRHAPS